MKITKVGSSFLDSGVSSTKSNKGSHNVHKYAQDRKPLITPIIKSRNNNKNGISNNSDDDNDDEGGQQYLLVPNQDHILVLSMEHGQTVCKLVPSYEEGSNENNRDGNKLRTIQTATIMKQKCTVYSGKIASEGEKWVVIAGFADGCLQEWLLSSIPLQSGKSKGILPQRIFKLENKNFTKCGITHITSPVGGEDGILYALFEDEKSNNRTDCHFLRISIPSLASEDEEDSILLKEHELLATISTGGSVNEQNEKNDQVQAFSLYSLPFALLSVCSERIGENVTYVAIVEKRTLIVYYENDFSRQSNSNKNRFVRIRKHMDQSKICAAAISPNGEDVSLGYADGKIDIIVSILSQCSTFVDDLSKTRQHPEQTLLKRTIHWHSLPVKTLCYLGQPGSRAAPNLLSGGEEAVLVTWNIERGLSRPSYTLPRISKGCITHITTNVYPTSSSSNSDGMDIVVRGMDNTLQLIHGNNHAIQWKIQGLASSNNECVNSVSSTENEPSVLLKFDPKTNMPVMTRLPGAPGFIHWYDCVSNQVVGELEVAPYNRISRKEAHHNAYPRPTVTNFIMSSSGNDLITVDTMLTENTSMGKGCKVKSFLNDCDDLSDKMSQITNIKFWAWSRETDSQSSGNQKGMPYEMISAMPNPHGIHGEVDGLAIAPLGNKACSLSYGEKTFHIWMKMRTTNATQRNFLSPPLPTWRRICKVTVPSGYSTKSGKEYTFDKNSNVAFSNDGSVLAIAFGSDVTLWDYSNATLLNTIRAPENLCDISFVRSPLDMILTVGKSSVSIMNSFGAGYLGDDCWTYKLQKNTVVEDKELRLGLVTPLTSRKELAVTIKESLKKGNVSSTTTKIVLVDIMTGQPKKHNDGSICSWHVEGNVQCLCDISQSEGSSDEVQLLVLTESNEVYLLDANSDDDEDVKQRGCFSRLQTINSSALSSVGVPKLLVGNKRKSDQLELSGIQSMKEDYDFSSVGKGSFIFDSTETAPLSTSQLPALTGSFTQSFISRKFKKSNQ